MAKAIALLSYLAVTQEPPAREHLLGLLLAESSEEAARKNLRNTLWMIRLAFGENTIVAGDDRLAINKYTWIDAHECERISDLKLRDPHTAICTLYSSVTARAGKSRLRKNNRTKQRLVQARTGGGGNKWERRGDCGLRCDAVSGRAWARRLDSALIILVSSRELASRENASLYGGRSSCG